MHIIKRMLILCVLLALGVALVHAQDVPELGEPFTHGDVTLAYPEDWTHFVDPNGTIFVSNGDLASIAMGGEVGEDVVFVQVIVAGSNVIPDRIPADEFTAEAVMRRLAPPDADLDVVVLEREDATPLAFLDQTTGDDENFVYVTLLDDATFALIIASGASEQVASKNDAILAIIDTIEVDFSVELAEGAAERYDIYEQSISEEGFPMLGDPDAPIRIVEVSSFDCPACGFFYNQILPVILERVEVGEVNFQYVSIFGTGGIPGGEDAAIAAFCAGEQDAFWAYHGLLFAWQTQGALAFNGTRLLNGALALDLDGDAFLECFSSEEVQESLTLARNYTASLGADYRGTPTIMINGVRVGNSAIEVVTAIDEILAQSDE